MIKKTGKMRVILIMGCLLLMLAGGSILCGCQKQESESTKEVKLEKGQSLVYGQIVSINGNEITYSVMEGEEVSTEEISDSQETEEDKKTAESSETERKERPQMPEGGFNGEMPEGFEPGEMPEGFEPGNMPEGFAEGERPQMPEGGFNGEMPEGFEPGNMPEGFEPGEMPEGFAEGERPQMPGGNRGEKQEETKETVTVQIPVGTPVTTRLGTETTFSRLAAGDNIKMLVQEEDGEQVILEIWIVD